MEDDGNKAEDMYAPGWGEGGELVEDGLSAVHHGEGPPGEEGRYAEVHLRR